MSDRIRIYELAAELGMSSRELMDFMADEGIEVKSHASTVDNEVADLIRDHVISERRSSSEQQEEHEEASAGEVELEESGEEPGEEEEEADTEGSKEIHLKPPVILRDLAEALGCKPNLLIGELMTMNVFATINQVLEPETAAKLCQRHGFNFVPEKREKSERSAKKKKQAPPSRREPRGKKKKTSGKETRAPIVAFLGHVDHGKTSLLDKIRKSDVTKDEAGGITQHIGASTVEWQGHGITFLDTPGHAAFSQMRSRGAQVTDLLVLVVAADDGVMPQTVEAIHHAQAAEVPIIVAMNKVDLVDADTDKVLLGMQQQELTPEEWGGQVGVVPVSAISGQGIEELLERIILEAELLELKADPSLPAEGEVIEAQLEAGMGPTASVVVRNGTLHQGDVVLCGESYGKLRALIGQKGERIEAAGPSTPVKLLGLSGVPQAGDQFQVVADEKEARDIAESRLQEKRRESLDTTRGASLEDLFQQMSSENRKELKLIVKADVQGSVEAIIDNLNKLESDKISIKVIHSGVGEVTENDILLASSADAIVIGFHVRASNRVNKTARQQGVEIRLYGIIYELLEDIKEAMVGRLEPELREVEMGTAEIREVFEISKTGRICGCYVSGGLIRVGASARVERAGDVIYNGQIKSLRRFKDDVKEVRQGFECGINLDNFEDFEVGDIIHVFAVEKQTPTL